MSAALAVQCRNPAIAGCSRPSVVSGGRNASRRTALSVGKVWRVARDVAPRVASEGRDMAASEPSFNDYRTNASLPSSIGAGSKGSDPTHEDSGLKRGGPMHAVSQPTTVTVGVASHSDAASEDVTSNAVRRVDSIASSPSNKETSLNSQKKREDVKIEDLQAVVLAGGPDTKNPMTRERARAALRVAASYRLIDFPLSNLLNSKVKQIYVLTQYNSFSLNSHITTAFPSGVFGLGSKPGFVDVLPSYQTPDKKDWATGSADVLRRHLQTGAIRGQFGNGEPEAYMLLSGEALYQMDYRQMLDDHNKKNADITIATHKVKAGDVAGLGVVASEPNGRVYNFKEKPTEKEIEQIADCEENQPIDECSLNASMGVYIISARAMRELIASTSHNSIGDVIPIAITQPDKYRVYAHKFEDHWQPIRNLREWFETNLSLTAARSSDAPLSIDRFVSGNSDVWTKARFLPPARFQGQSEIVSSITSDGSITRPGCFIKDSIVGPSAVIGKGCQLERCIITGSPGDNHGKDSKSPADIGDGSVLREVVCDAMVRIGANCVITNKAGVQELDKTEEGYVISDGIVTILRGATIPDGTVI